MNQRILRNQVDASPGGGAPPAGESTSSAPSAPPAQVTTPPALSAELAAAIDAAADRKVAEAMRNARFADARRSGQLAPKARTTVTTQTTEEAAAAHAASAPDIGRLRMLDRAVATSGRQISEAAYVRLERSFTEESPEDVSTWLRDYFDGFGGSPAPAAPAQQQTTTSAPQGAPATARGSQPPPTVPLEDKPVLQMTEDERNRFIKTKGVRAYTEKLAAEKKQLGRVPTK